MCHHENNIITELIHVCDICTAASYTGIRNIFETVVGCEHLHIHIWHKGGIFLCDICNLIISTFKMFHVLSKSDTFYLQVVTAGLVINLQNVLTKRVSKCLLDVSLRIEKELDNWRKHAQKILLSFKWMWRMIGKWEVLSKQLKKKWTGMVSVI